MVPGAIWTVGVIFHLSYEISPWTYLGPNYSREKFWASISRNARCKQEFLAVFCRRLEAEGVCKVNMKLLYCFRGLIVLGISCLPYWYVNAAVMGQENIKKVHSLVVILQAMKITMEFFWWLMCKIAVRNLSLFDVNGIHKLRNIRGKRKKKKICSRYVPNRRAVSTCIISRKISW